MLSIISGVLTGFLGPIASAVGAYFKAKSDEERQIALAAYQLAATAAGQFLVVAFGLPIAFYLAKCLVWDAALHLGTTDAVHGETAQLMWIVMGFITGHAIVTRIKG